MMRMCDGGLVVVRGLTVRKTKGYPDMCNLLDGLVELGCIMKDVKDMGQQMGYRSLEWN